MTKKKLIKWIIIGIIIGVLVPAPIKQKDGGTIIYKATLYQVIKLHRLNEWSSDGYDTGTIVKVLGIEVYNNLKKHDVSMKELEGLNEKIIDKAKDYDNFVSSYVDEYKKEILIGLKDNSEEKQKKFQEEISDSEYLSFIEIKDNLSIIYMYIKNDTLKNNQATIVINDIGDEKHLFDGYYRIEKQENDKWIELNSLKEPNWQEMKIKVLDSGDIEQDLNWKDYYGELPKGYYRIIKRFVIEDTNDTKEINTEFSIFE